ncbi:MAG: UDP-N-acetylglucosamine pyrophosphorylase [Bullifex sp.]
MYTVNDLFDLNHTMARDYLSSFRYPWEALPGIREMITALGKTLGDDFTEVSPEVWVHETANVFPSAYLGSPCIIGAGTEIRHCAFIRGAALVGENCVVGNSVELKNVILFDGVQVPHFNYAGDSILGYMSHMGAGSITSNVRSDKKPVVIKNGKEWIETGLDKAGAMLGDFAEIGCNAVLNPGTVVGRRSIIYPTGSVRGVIPEDSIFRNDGTVIRKVR